MEIEPKCTQACTPNAAEALPTKPPFQKCDEVTNTFHTEGQVLCDYVGEELVGTALAVYNYGENGSIVGAPQFVAPTTGEPYVVQGVLRPCVNLAHPAEGEWTTTNGADTRLVAEGECAVGEVPAGMASVNITNVGKKTGTVGGLPLLPGETYAITAYADYATKTFVRTPSIIYDASNTTYRIWMQF